MTHLNEIKHLQRLVSNSGDQIGWRFRKSKAMIRRRGGARQPPVVLIQSRLTI